MSSKRDREILNAIVNPLLPVGEGIFDDEEKVPKELKDEGEEDTKVFRYDQIYQTKVKPNPMLTKPSLE